MGTIPFATGDSLVMVVMTRTARNIAIPRNRDSETRLTANVRGHDECQL